MAKCEKDFTDSCKIIFEQSIAIDGYSYLVIVGKHIRGGFITISEKGIYVEASLQDKYYNAGKLEGAGLTADFARELSEYIDNFIKENGINTSGKDAIERLIESKGFHKNEKPLFERAENC